jgi:hypothetical protein
MKGRGSGCEMTKEEIGSGNLDFLTRVSYVSRFRDRETVFAARKGNIWLVGEHSRDERFDIGGNACRYTHLTALFWFVYPPSLSVTSVLMVSVGFPLNPL